MPVLLITGSLDEKFTEINGRMAAQMSQVHLHTVPQVGHNVHLEAPGEYVDIVQRFLKGKLQA
jgi:2-succinyl-6-hydroxy-2,4-cyclohexadiene-1-carboxylate synthase